MTTVQFAYGTDMDAASSQLQTAVTRLQSQLPEDVEPQVVTGSVDDLPVIQLAVSGGADEAALADTVTSSLVPALRGRRGVRSVAVSGVADQQVTVALDPAALAAAGLSPQQVSTILQDNGVVVPAGTVAEGDRTLSVQVGTAVTSVDELAALPLVSPTAAPGTQPVALGDVATVTAGPEPATSFSASTASPRSPSPSPRRPPATPSRSRTRSRTRSTTCPACSTPRTCASRSCSTRPRSSRSPSRASPRKACSGSSSRSS